MKKHGGMNHEACEFANQHLDNYGLKYQRSHILSFVIW